MRDIVVKISTVLHAVVMEDCLQDVSSFPFSVRIDVDEIKVGTDLLSHVTPFNAVDGTVLNGVNNDADDIGRRFWKNKFVIFELLGSRLSGGYPPMKIENPFFHDDYCLTILLP